MERDYIDDGRGRGRMVTGGWGVQRDEGTSTLSPPLSPSPSDGDFPSSVGKSRPNDQDGDDMYDFDATGSSRHSYKRSDSKTRKQKKESKLAPKTKTMTTEERVAGILARTRSPATSGGGTPKSAAAAAAAPGGLNDSGRPWSPATPSAGEEMRTGVFSDFAKSLRDMRVEQLELSGDTDGGVLEGGEGRSVGERVDKWATTEGKRPRDGAEDGYREGNEEGQVHGGPVLDMSDSLVIDDADMEVGGYARAREELRRSKEVARGHGLTPGVGAGESSNVSTKSASEGRKDVAADPTITVAAVVDAAGIAGDGASKAKRRDEGRREICEQQRGRCDENSHVSVGQHGSGVADGDGFLEQSNQAAARVAEATVTEGFNVGKGGAAQSHSSEERWSSRLPAQSWDESYEDEGFEAEEAEDDKEKGPNEISQQLSEKRPSTDPSRNNVTDDRKSDEQPRSGVLQPIPRYSLTTASAETAVAGADGGDINRDTESPRRAGDGAIASLVSGFLPSSPPRESAQSLPPAPPTSPPPSPQPSLGNRDGQGEAVAKITREDSRGSGSGVDCGDGWPESDLPPTDGVESAMLLRSAIQLRPSTPPSPPPPPPSHLPDDELGEFVVDGNASGHTCSSLRGDRRRDARRDTLSMMSHKQRQGSKEGNGGRRGTEKYSSGTAQLTVNEKRQGSQADIAAASGATQDTTPSSFRQRSRAHDDAASIIGGRLRELAVNPVRILTTTEDPRTTTNELPAGATRITIPSAGAGYGGGGSSLAANSRVTPSRSEYRRTGADDRDSDKRPQTEMDMVFSPACSARDRVLMAESPLVGVTSASGDSGPWEVPTSAPSLTELEYQLRQLSPLRAAGDTRYRSTRGATPTKAKWKTVGSNTSANKQASIGRSPRGNAIGVSKHGGSRRRGGGEVGVHASVEGRKGASAAGLEGSYQGQHRRQALSRDDLGFGSRGRGGIGAGGSSFRGEEGRNAADLSSVVLVSSLSSTPSKRRSVSGRWASSGQAGRSIIGRVELGVDALSAAHWELTEAEKGMQARELGLKPRERGAADADGEDKNKQEREREVRVVREEAERQLEKAKAEIYALQVKLEEKRALTPTHASRMLDYDGMDRRRGGGDGQRPNAKTSANGGLVAQQKREEGGSGEAEKEGGRTALAVEIELLRAESEGMKKEIAEQERLLAAYQKENEKLLGQAKKDKAEYEEERLSLYRDRERLNKECNRLANERGGSGGGSGQSDAGGGGGDGGGGGSMAFAVQARLEAESALAEARSRESELMFEIDRLRKVKRVLEAKVAASTSAGDEGAAGAAAALGSEVKRLQELLSQEREARAEEQRANRKKLDWYAENQELVDGHLEKIDEQGRELTRLRDALSKEGGSRVGGRRPADMRKIKDLEAQLAELAEALRRRNPDCIANLIRAARPTMSQEMQRDGYAKKIGELEAELARQKTESELKLRSLRQEHDRVKTGLQRQLERLGGTVGGGGGSGGGVVRRSLTSRGGDVGAGTGRSAARGSGAGVGAGTGVRGSQQQQDRVAELEKKLSQVGAFYKRKLKDVERRAEAQMRALKRRGVYNITPTTATADGSNSHNNGIDSDDLNGDKTARGGHDFQQTNAKQQERYEGEQQQRQQQRQRRQLCAAGYEDTSSNNNRDFVTQTAAAAPSTHSPTTTAPVVHTPATAYTQQRSDTATAGRGNDVNGARGHEHTDAPLDRGREGERAFWAWHGGSGGGGEGAKTREALGVGVGAGMGRLSGTAEFDRVLEVERARYERELGQEREAAEARMSALKLRLVQTAQALGKAQAREQAASWGRGKDAADPEPPLNTNTNANNIPNCSAAAQPWHTTRGADDPHTAAIAVAEAAEAREKAKVLKLTAAVADERRASAAKDLERSEDMRRRLEAEVLALRAKLSEPSTPSQLRYTELARKVEEMELRTARREGELQRVLEESRQQSKIELSRLQALHAEEMRAKDALVHGFRAELDALLRAAAQFMNGAGAASAAMTAAGGTGIGRGQHRGGRDGVRAVGNDGTSPPWGLVS